MMLSFGRNVVAISKSKLFSKVEESLLLVHRDEFLERTHFSTTSLRTANDKKLYSATEETHFGFQTVTEDEKAEKVKHVFENVSSRYDLMNDCMSLGIHRIWKDIFVHRLNPGKNTKLIDVAGGTGDIAFRFLNYSPSNTLPQDILPLRPDIFPFKDMPGEKIAQNEVEAQYQANEESKAHTDCETSEKSDSGRSVLVCDINPKMLQVGQSRASSMIPTSLQTKINWLEGDAENLHTIPDSSFDAYTIAFGIRNCVHVDKVLSEAYRVLRRGGRFMCLEFSHVPNSTLRWFYDQYSFQVIPALGQVVAGDWDSYQYLVESIRKFPNQEAFQNMIKDAGFKFVKYENLTFGVAAIHSGFKF